MSYSWTRICYWRTKWTTWIITDADRARFAQFAGKKILGIWQMNETELDDMMWGDEPHPAIVILCEGHLALIVSQDEEGNGPGALFVSTWGLCEVYDGEKLEG